MKEFKPTKIRPKASQEYGLHKVTTTPTRMMVLDDRLPSKQYIKSKLDARIDDTIYSDGWDGVTDKAPSVNAVYDKINSIGKQWIRRFGLALSKEMLGHVRSKFASIPIPGESITLNGESLVSQAKEEQTALREELKTVLDEMTYDKLVEKDAGIVANVGTMQEKLPMGIFTG